MKYEAFRIPIRVVFYRESGDWIAHCLEFDLMGHGATQREALQRLSEAIEMQADAAFQHGNPANLFSPADGKFFRMFAAGDDCCQGELQIRIRGNNVIIERAEYREYAGTPMAFAQAASVPYPLKKLRRILVSYDAWEDASRGRGSHTMFFRNVDGNVFSFPIPTHDKDVNDCQVSGVRKRFKLSAKDGVSDEEFFGRG